MNIGSFKMVNGMLLGSVATAALDMPRLGLKPIQSDNPRAPAFEIMAQNPARRWVKVGAVWEATTREGETFYQGRIDDPSLAEPLPVALFRDSYSEVEAYAVAWSRPKRNDRDGFGGGAQTERRAVPQQSGGFEGNAGDDGQLVPETAGADGGRQRDDRGRFVGAGGFGDDLDDQVPF